MPGGWREGGKGKGEQRERVERRKTDTRRLRGRRFAEEPGSSGGRGQRGWKGVSVGWWNAWTKHWQAGGEASIAWTRGRETSGSAEKEGEGGRGKKRERESERALVREKERGGIEVRGKG